MKNRKKAELDDAGLNKWVEILGEEMPFIVFT